MCMMAMLLGCSAMPESYTQGRALLAKGQSAQAVEKLDEALRLRPNSGEVRMAYRQARAQYQLDLLAQAARALKQGEWDEAERQYGLALAQDPSDGRALSGLRQVDAARRLDKLLKEAEAAVAAQDVPMARGRLRSVLMEQPDHAGAQRLLRQLDSGQKAASASADALLAMAYRKPVSIEFKDTPLKTIFEVLSRTSGLNFLLDKDVKTDQKTSIFLKESTIEAAVNLTLLTNQLEQRVLDANTVLIYPSTQAKQKDYQPLTVKTFYLAHAEAKAVSTTIKTILKSRDVIVDDKLNMVIMRDTPEAVRMAEKLVALHDVPDAEVMLEVEILEVKRSRLLDLGVRWPDQATLTPLPSASGGPLTVADLHGINASRIGVGVGGITLNAKKQDTDASILANPRIRTRNREKAKILIGEKVPNITTTATSTGFVSDSVNYVEVGLKLDVEPVIYLDQEVAIKIALEVSSIVGQVQTKSGSLAYQIGTRVAQTVLRLRDGENQVLAGLINDEDRRSAYKVPGLGEVPVLGRLFGSQADDTTKTEIVLSITPRIIRGIQRPPADTLEFESGTESNLGNRVLSGLVSGGGIGAAAAGAAGSVGTPAAGPAPAKDAPAQSEASAAGSLSWDGPAQARPGQTLSVTLQVDTAEPLRTVPLSFGFDPTLLQLQQITEGGFMKQDGGQSTQSSRIDPKGRAYVSLAREGMPAKGRGELVTLSFKVLATAQVDASVDLISATPQGDAGMPVSLNVPPPFKVNLKP